MASAVIPDSPEPMTDEQLAERYAGGLLYGALLQAGEPQKVSEVVALVNRPDIDSRLARVILTTNPDVTSVDRKWTLWTRYLDIRHTVDNNLRRIFNAFGQPIRIPYLAQEMQTLYGRPAEIYEEMLARLADAGSQYFRIGDDYIAPTDWLLVTHYEDEDEVLFDNFLSDDETLTLIANAESAKLSADDPASVAAFLDAVGQPVKQKVVQFLAWRTDKTDFDAQAFYSQAFLESGAGFLTDGTWIGPKRIAKLVAQFSVLAEREVSDNAEAEAQEAAQPLVIGDKEREQLVQTVLNSDGTIFADRLIEDIFEITPDYRTYNEDLRTVVDSLRQDDRVLWVGSNRFRPQGTLPAYVFSVPGLLEIPELSFVDVEGNPLDQLLEDEGFDGGLEREIFNPFAQDVLDEEAPGLPDPNPPSNVRVVIKYHHKQIGTLPLCQFPSGFFPPEPVILEVEFLLPGGQKAQVWVNNETRLLYGLLDWFESIPINSGATFTLERQALDRYLVTYNNESEPSMFISDNRIKELMELQEQADNEEMSTFDIMRIIMEHYRKGIEFLTLHTEVNVVRRVTRRLVASNLSAYHCYFQRGGAWVFDAKKLTQGFDKSKRKYLVK
jgi:hypothetical protein